MAIDLATGFNIGSKDAIDERQVLTLEQMKNLDESIYPDKYFAICKDNGKLYLYNVNNIVDSETGKFRVLEGNTVGDGTTDSAYTTVVFDKSIDMGKYLLLAKITNANYANNIIKFSCPNFKGQNQVGFRYEDDMDIYKFELHFNTGSMREPNGYGVTLKQHGLGLYSYPLNDPQNTEPKIEEAIRLYWDYSKGDIYVFLVDMMTAIPHCVLEYTGSGTLLRENTFVMDDIYNWRDGINGTWEESKWKSIPYNKLETPPIYELGGGSGSAEGATTYTSLSQLGLTADATIDDVRDKLQVGESCCIRTDAFTNWSTLFNSVQWGYLKITKTVNGLCEIWLNDITSDNRLYYGIQASGKFSKWQQVQTRLTYVSLSQLGLTADATIDDVINALKEGETALISTNEFTNYKDGMFPNQCTNDQYAVIKVEKESGSKVFLEWRQKAGNAYAIGGLDGSNKFTNWDNLVRFKKDGFADDSIVCIGNTLSSDGVIQTLESLGFSNDILTWSTGVYRVSHVSELINLPSDIVSTAPAFRLEHYDCKKWGGNHNPNTNTYAVRHSVLYAEKGNIYHRYYESGDTSGVYENDTGWQQIHTKKEDDSYIPDMYDRNANGDMPVVGFDRLADSIAVRTNRGLVSTTETEATYDEDYVGGYVFAGANDILVKDKEMFNKIKVLVHIPGVLRIGIVNDKIYEANPRYSTCLVKWLVADFVAFTGLKEYDIDDTVLEEGQSIFLECRVGVSSWYLNTGEATQVGAITYPANSCTTGLNVFDKLDTTTNNALFKSQKVNSSSCLTSFGSSMYSIGGKIRGNFKERAYNNGATSSKETYENTEYFGGLNIGLYRRTKYSDTRFCKCVENCDSVSIVGNGTSYTKLFASLGQEALEGKSVYAFKLDVNTIGNITIYHMKGTTKDTVEIIDKYTHYVRAKGLQTIHLPFDIKLGKGEYIGFGGIHCKSTSDNVVQCECKWHYKYNTKVSWMNTYDTRSTGFYNMSVDLATYPERFTEFGVNTSYLNIELICRGEKRSPLEDKYISFTGDSITTFAGFCTTKTGYPEGNPAGDNAVYYPASGKVINNIDATWWGILARDNRMKILRNDAWSGSRVSSSEGSTDTKCLCGANRRYYLRNGYDFATNSSYPFGRPEIIVSMIGTNDLSGGVELGQEMFKGVTGAEEEYKTILSAFSLFCRRIHDQEGRGGVKIVHFLIPRGSDYGYANANGVTIADLSLHFERIAKAWGQYFIPLSYFNGIKPNAPKRWSCPTGSLFKNTSGIEFPSADGLHPNAMGMEVIADGVHRFLCNIL